MPSNFSGIAFVPLAVQIPPSNISASISLAGVPVVGVFTYWRPFTGPKTFNPNPTPNHGIPGNVAEVFGGWCLFERVIMNPVAAALGFIITDTQFTVEVWNTSRYVGQILNSIAIVGVGDLQIVNPGTIPTFYAALGSRVYQVLAPRTGAPQIASSVSFNFASGIAGSSMTVSGNRVVLFSPPIDWGYGARESVGYLTDVLVGYSDMEQRRALRQTARRGMSFKAKGLTARNAAGMESQIWGWSSQPYGVPWWADATPLTVNAAAGTTVVQCSTVDRQFAPGGICCIWQDEFTFEALSILSLTSSSITLTNPLQNNWTAGPTVLVMPVFLARIPNKIPINRLFSGADEIDVDFAGEAQQVAPAPSQTLTQYRGFDVLEIPANWPTDQKRQYERSIVLFDTGVAPITAIDKGGTPITSQPFPWLMLNHSQVTTLRAFMLARFGRFKPFWIPTWDQDLVLVQDVLSTDTGIKIQSEFYTRFMFPNKARRYVALIPAGQTGNVYRQITAAVDNGDGTETITFDSPVGTAFTAATTMVSFLVFARLDKDEIEIDWLNNDLAQTTVEIRELPREVP